MKADIKNVTAGSPGYLIAMDKVTMIRYLAKEKKRIYDPELFDVLKEMCKHNEKSVWSYYREVTD